MGERSGMRVLWAEVEAYSGADINTDTNAMALVRVLGVVLVLKFA